MRSLLHSSRDWVARHGAGLLHRALGRRRDAGFAILMYHRITDEPAGVAAPTWNVTPQRLHEQLSSLITAGYQPWPLTRALARRRSGREIPASALVVTFDDGYRNNYTRAWPVLRELNVPATIFVATASLDSTEPFPFDDWAESGSSRVPADTWMPLTTDDCREMLAGGLIALGTHTHTHQSFLGRPHDFREDLRTSLAVLREKFAIGRPAFAAPFGHVDHSLINVARQEGCACLLTAADGDRQGLGDFCWGRFGVEDTDSPAALASKLSGWHTPIDRVLRNLARPFRVMRPSHHPESRRVQFETCSGANGAGCAPPWQH